MFDNLITYPIESPLLKWESKIVVRDDAGKPRLYLRLKLTGTIFPIFDTEPFVRVGDVAARFIAFSDDGMVVNAYFEHALPEGGVVEFGYDDQVLLRFPRRFLGLHVTRLDEARLPRELRHQEVFFRPEIG